MIEGNQLGISKPIVDIILPNIFYQAVIFTN